MTQIESWAKSWTTWSTRVRTRRTHFFLRFTKITPTSLPLTLESDLVRKWRNLSVPDLRLEAFIEATESFAVLFHAMFGLSLAKRDVLKNVRVLRAFQKDLTFEDFLSQIAANDTSWKDGKDAPLTSCLWLLLTLSFAAKMLRAMAANKSVSLHEAVQRAYDSTLGPHHSPFAARMFRVVNAAAAPSRQVFVHRVAEDEQNFSAICSATLPSVISVLTYLQNLLRQTGIDVDCVGGVDAHGT